jgi:hypothetical protein
VPFIPSRSPGARKSLRKPGRRIAAAGPAAHHRHPRGRRGPKLGWAAAAGAARRLTAYLDNESIFLWNYGMYNFSGKEPYSTERR